MIIDGKQIASRLLEELKKKVARLPRPPKLAIVTKGNDPVTVIYIRKKIAAAKYVGIETEVIGSVGEVSPDADGIIIQLPYPDEDEEIAKIPLKKDIDDLTGKSKFLPAAVKAVLVAAGDLQDKMVVAVGQGRLVGKPLADHLEKNKCKVIRCDVSTPNLKKQILRGDILVVATGVPHLITVDMVKPGAVVIDCGSPKAEVDFVNVSKIASAITPVPGGIGPLTVFSLLDNCFHACHDEYQ